MRRNALRLLAPYGVRVTRVANRAWYTSDQSLPRAAVAKKQSTSKPRRQVATRIAEQIRGCSVMLPPTQSLPHRPLRQHRNQMRPVIRGGM